MVADDILQILGGSAFIVNKKRCSVRKLDNGVLIVLPVLVNKIHRIKLFKDNTTAPLSVRLEFIRLQEQQNIHFATVTVYNKDDLLSVINLFTTGFFDSVTA